MKHATGGTGENRQVARILENQSCIQKSILLQTSGECGGRLVNTDITVDLIAYVSHHVEISDVALTPKAMDSLTLF